MCQVARAMPKFGLHDQSQDTFIACEPRIQQHEQLRQKKSRIILKPYSSTPCGSRNPWLGNRDNICSNYGVPIGEGRIVNCPLCIVADNTEVHVLVECTELQSARERIKVGSISLAQTLITIHASTSSPQSSDYRESFSGSGSYIIFSKNPSSLADVAWRP